MQTIDAYGRDSYCVDIVVSPKSIKEIRNWCEMNFVDESSNWRNVVRIADDIFGYYGGGRFRAIFYFNNEADAVAFKLMYGYV